MLIDADVPIPAVARYMGHASPAITLNMYAHALSGTEADDAVRVDGYLARVGA
jgi:integrase